MSINNVTDMPHYASLPITDAFTVIHDKQKPYSLKSAPIAEALSDPFLNTTKRHSTTSYVTRSASQTGKAGPEHSCLISHYFSKYRNCSCGSVSETHYLFFLV